MSNKGVRLGRRKLSQRIQCLEKEVAAKKISESTTANIVRRNLELGVEVARLQLAVDKERERADSINDMIGAFELRILGPDAIRGMRFERWSLCLDIMPEAYMMSWMRGGKGNLRNFSAFAREVGFDFAKKVEKKLLEQASKILQNHW